MKKRIHLSLFACLFFAGASVGKAEITVQLVNVFPYPGPDFGLNTGQINDSNFLVGYAHFETGVEGFYSHSGNLFSAPFREPDDTGGVTVPCGINNHLALCGYYHDNVDFTTKGFIKMGESYSSFVAPVDGGVRSTRIYSINDAGNFVGSYTASIANAYAFAVINGVFAKLPIPGATREARGINNLNQIVGDYSYHDSERIYYGYLLDPDGWFGGRYYPSGSADRTGGN